MNSKILQIMTTVLKCKVDSTTTQLNCTNWDSLHHLNLIVALEIEFNVEFEPEEIASIHSVSDIENILTAKLK